MNIFKLLKKLIRKPFKGGLGYEIQIGSLVFILKYPHSNFDPYRKNYELKVYNDKYWLK